MDVSVIKGLCETHGLDELKAAEEAILDEANPSIDVSGQDEGEKLTHVLAAIWIKEEMSGSGCDITTAVRNYSKKVRKSIS